MLISSSLLRLFGKVYKATHSPSLLIRLLALSCRKGPTPHLLSSFKNRPKGILSCVLVAKKVVASVVVTFLECQFADVKDS